MIKWMGQPLMAHSQQARKRIRQTATRTAVNKSRKSRMRTYLRRVDEAIETDSNEDARQALRNAESEIMRAVTRGVVNKNTARRRISRLAKRAKLAS